jgi:membrane fusion protein, heavy metal efflux system
MATSSTSAARRGTTPAMNSPRLPAGSRASSIATAVPNIVVFGLLVGVFYLGHHTGWKLPKTSTLFGANSVTESDWCAEHVVAESECLECNPNLKPQLPTFGWCDQHGVSECVVCHPELSQAKPPQALPAYDTAAAIGIRPRLTNNSLNTLHAKIVQFASAAAVEQAGVEVDVVGTAPMRETVEAPGEVNFDPTRVAHLSSRVSGTVWRVLKQIGEPVAPGETLALIEAANVGQTKAQWLQAISGVRTSRARLERLQALEGAVAGRSLIEAEALSRESDIQLVAAEQALVNLGFRLPEYSPSADLKQLAVSLRLLGVPTQLASSLGAETQSSNLFPLVSPAAGTLISAHAVQGETVDANHDVFVVADPSRLTLRLNVRQEDAGLVTLGQGVEFATDDGASASGRIDWISPTVEVKSRTLPVRVTLARPAGTLRDNTFGVGRIVLREEPRAIVVPRSAVQSAGDVQLVFVRDRNYFAEGSAKYFHVRQVRIGARDEVRVELLAGALPGEVVATVGSNVLLAQLLRGTFGEGCGHGHHH